ncbi:MAG: carbonic anhydrase [Thermoanaerobaculales bacterium]|nr:carbonic anhydrase [Thermoanaerobaculales bacterium]
MPTSKLISGYRQFREKFDSNHEVFEKLAEEGQNPKVLWIGCADSRVVPELITGSDPGELFDVRNIANVVPPASSAACATGAAVEYAVIHLNVRHIVVCGHTDCGGIKALESPPQPESQPHIDSWLEFARPARDRVLDSAVSEEERYLETIKTNVLMQCENLRSYPCVADGERSGGLSIHPWLYDLNTGKIFAWNETSETWGAVAEQL